MSSDHPLPLLGGLSPAQFMRRYWQRKPLLVRQALPEAAALLPTRAELVALAADEAVESRLVQGAGDAGVDWSLERGPFARRALPAFSAPKWTLLVQGVDLHHDGAHGLRQRFSFLPAARLDDVMISLAGDQGGVGPHFDSYDVFLLQVAGRRRWRIGAQRDLRLREGVPLKILANFVPQQEFVLEPGDMLYLPPRYAHDGIAEGPCMTCSVGFRAPRRGALARELLQRMAEAALEEDERLYADPSQPATAAPGAIPASLEAFAADALRAAMAQPQTLQRALGEVLSEPKAGVWFEAAGAEPELPCAVRLDRRSRMLHDARHVFLNGESFRAGGRDARLMRRLADEGRLGAADVARLSPEATDLLRGWLEDGWLRVSRSDAGATDRH